MSIKLYEYKVTVIAAYVPSEDERMDKKQEFFEKMEEVLTNIDNKYR